jgi:hypothetical protein
MLREVINNDVNKTTTLLQVITKSRIGMGQGRPKIKVFKMKLPTDVLVDLMYIDV